MNPTIKELVVYVPAKEYAVSKSFYTALGFELTEGWGDTMDCRLGAAYFRLQNYYVKDWANNFMMKLAVDDIDMWYQHVKNILSENDYGDARCDQDGPELLGDTKILHVVDPSGVLLVFIQ